MFRTKSFDEMLSKELMNPEFAREFLLGLLESDEDLELFDALKHTIRKMGIKEFSEVSGITPPSISRTLSQETPPKIQTLNKFLLPFKLKVRIEVESVA